MFRQFVFVAALLAAPPAWAQVPDQAPPSLEDVSAAKAHADALIDNGQAREFFVNVTTTGTPTVRHVPSGLTCEFAAMDQRDVIRIYEQAVSGSQRGEDVSCGSWIGRTYVTLFATRYPEPQSRENLFDFAVKQVQRNWPHARAYEGFLDILVLDGQDDPLVAAFDVELEGQPRRSLVILHNLGEWSFKARATGPATDDSVGELASMAFALALPSNPANAAERD